MDIEHLRFFSYIAKYKNITNAAKHLYISQSTLSRQIMSLENELGTKLFNRDGKQLTLTKVGEALLAECGPLIDHFDAVIHTIDTINQGVSGTIRITAPTHIITLLKGTLDDLRRHYPDIQLIVESYIFNEVPSAVAFNLYNVGVTYDYSASDDDYLETTVIGQEDFAILFASQFEADTPEATLRQLANKIPFVMPIHDNPPSFKGLMALLQSYATSGPLHTYQVNNTESMISDIALGLGFGFVPSRLAEITADNKNVSMVKVPNLDTTCNVVLVYKKEGNSPATQKFIELVNQKKPLVYS